LDNYATAEPFPHCVIDDFAAPKTLRKILDEWPAQMLAKESATSIKMHLSEFDKFGPTTQKFIQELNSGRFIQMLESLTGIDNLISDPYLMGGGLHHINPGGYLNVHADFNWHPKLKAVRKINLLLYLNEDWTANGDLLLCDTDYKVIKTIPPIFNRCVIFNTTSTSYHGHPEPLTGDRPRRSIALYYYRTEMKPKWTHTTLYV
jgi:Rps23 Pro-64 3,4-dihydroxylase Tpa1-like proline 4-hydroxylase